MSTGVSLTRGADMGFRLRSGMGYIESPVVINARRIGILFGNQAEGIRVSMPEIMWTGADTVGRIAFHFGEESTNAICIDNEINGGYAYGYSGMGTPAVRMRCGINGQVNRNKIHGVTFRSWDVGLDFVAFGGTVGATSFQFNQLRHLVSPLTTDGGDTETVFDNNVTNTGLGA
jgi:hypothetical protein